jgi:NAD(P)-dependent dehydrogenase (short-subunit alcohol dehydrogenase family)
MREMKNRESLEGRNVIIVGGSSGIGLATARGALEKGARVTITGRSQERLDSARAVLGELAERLETHALDALDRAGTAAFFAGFHDIDHLFVTPGSYVVDLHLEPDIDTMREPMDRRFISALQAAKHAYPKLVRDEASSITLMSGTATVRPLPGAAMSGASCAAVEALARALALDFAPIRVNALRAGFFDTPFLDEALGNKRAEVIAMLKERLPLHRIGRPEEAAHAVLFMMENRFVTGISLTVDGGGSLA